MKWRSEVNLADADETVAEHGGTKTHNTHTPCWLKYRAQFYIYQLAPVFDQLYAPELACIVFACLKIVR